MVAGNPVHNCPNRGLWLDEIFPQMELIVDVDIWMTDTGHCCRFSALLGRVRAAGHACMMAQSPMLGRPA